MLCQKQWIHSRGLKKKTSRPEPGLKTTNSIMMIKPWATSPPTPSPTPAVSPFPFSFPGFSRQLRKSKQDCPSFLQITHWHYLQFLLLVVVRRSNHKRIFLWFLSDDINTDPCRVRLGKSSIQEMLPLPKQEIWSSSIKSRWTSCFLNEGKEPGYFVNTSNLLWSEWHEIRLKGHWDWNLQVSLLFLLEGEILLEPPVFPPIPSRLARGVFWGSFPSWPPCPEVLFPGIVDLDAVVLVWP